MLVLTRKLGENIRIGDSVKITVLEVRSGQVKLGIEAPPADTESWRSLIERADSAEDTVKIALVGKYVKLEDAYLSVSEALRQRSHARRVERGPRQLTLQEDGPFQLTFLSAHLAEQVG